MWISPDAEIVIAPVFKNEEIAFDNGVAMSSPVAHTSSLPFAKDYLPYCEGCANMRSQFL